jgi:hypothetical protein
VSARALSTWVLSAALAGCGTSVDLGGTGGADGGLDATQCGALVGPTVPAACRACNLDASDCQPNGCYGGYWCNTSDSDCRAPPQTCP